MPSGKHLDKLYRELIVHFHLNLSKSPDIIYRELFNSDPTKISLGRIVDICIAINNEIDSYGSADVYLSGPAKRYLGWIAVEQFSVDNIR